MRGALGLFRSPHAESFARIDRRSVPLIAEAGFPFDRHPWPFRLKERGSFQGTSSRAAIGIGKAPSRWTAKYRAGGVEASNLARTGSGLMRGAAAPAKRTSALRDENQMRPHCEYRHLGHCQIVFAERPGVGFAIVGAA